MPKQPRSHHHTASSKAGRHNPLGYDLTVNSVEEQARRKQAKQLAKASSKQNGRKNANASGEGSSLVVCICTYPLNCDAVLGITGG